jgi:hypothetical protein
MVKAIKNRRSEFPPIGGSFAPAHAAPLDLQNGR